LEAELWESKFSAFSLEVFLLIGVLWVRVGSRAGLEGLSFAYVGSKWFMFRKRSLLDGWVSFFHRCFL
jgi:hypothetical protein